MEVVISVDSQLVVVILHNVIENLSNDGDYHTFVNKDESLAMLTHPSNNPEATSNV